MINRLAVIFSCVLIFWFGLNCVFSLSYLFLKQHSVHIDSIYLQSSWFSMICFGILGWVMAVVVALIDDLWN
jgi:hypothetical protein